jgi:hypothetical protein
VGALPRNRRIAEVRREEMLSDLRRAGCDLLAASILAALFSAATVVLFSAEGW